ncbi:MAG: enoyl-CoA hydratase/isomerase family protein [Rhodospirillales bacterium]|nr:MAG: enoyl-CoA hydratase/isomerase family protein [Rhodospirillales bacterium]
MPDIRVSNEGGIVRLVIDHVEKHNAMTLDMWRRLGDALEALTRDDRARVIVVSGAGDKAFCTGNDISEFGRVRDTAERIAVYNAATRRACDLLKDIEKPTIAAIQGFCMGGGLEIALLCDLRYASAASRFAIPAAKLGLPYRYEDLAAVAASVGAARTREMLYTGRQYDAADAARIGLVLDVVADRAALDRHIDDTAATIAANAPLTQRACKLMLKQIARRDAPPDVAYCHLLADEVYASADYAEGRRARDEKRKPAFTGR